MKMSSSLLEMDNQYIPVDPIWVVDPRSKKLVNVQPFLDALNTFDSQPDSPINAGCIEAVRRIIRNMTLMVHDDPGISPFELSNMYYDLWRLLDMFETTGAVIDKKSVS